MKKENKSREEIIQDWLTLYPKQALEFETNENGNIVVLVPHHENWFTKKFLPKPKGPASKISLDDFGSFVWQNCTGENAVTDICKQLEEKFGEQVMPVEERTVKFVQQMYNEKFVTVFRKS